jgi:prepilin-type N-terminal cleavage/methylation domain-containing protein
VPKRTRRQSAFSLIELIIVVVIIGVIASMVIPRISPATDSAVESTLAADIRVMSEAIDSYTAEHSDRPPDHDETGAADTNGTRFARRLTERTDTNGKLVEDGAYGPYVFQFPTNPINRKATVRVGPPAAGANTHGWQYDPDRQIIRSDDGDGYATFDPLKSKITGKAGAGT